MNGIPELRRAEKCATCAFTAGSQANRSHTPLKAKLCAEIPDVFLCHEDQPKDVACAGWSELTERLLAEGYYEKQPAFQREIKQTILEALCETEARDDSSAFIGILREKIAEKVTKGA